MQPNSLGIAGEVVVPNENVVGTAGRLRFGNLGQGSIEASETLAGPKIFESKRAVAEVRGKTQSAPLSAIGDKGKASSAKSKPRM